MYWEKIVHFWTDQYWLCKMQDRLSAFNWEIMTQPCWYTRWTSSCHIWCQWWQFYFHYDKLTQPPPFGNGVRISIWIVWICLICCKPTAIRAEAGVCGRCCPCAITKGPESYPQLLDEEPSLSTPPCTPRWLAWSPHLRPGCPVWAHDHHFQSAHCLGLTTSCTFRGHITPR